MIQEVFIVAAWFSTELRNLKPAHKRDFLPSGQLTLTPFSTEIANGSEGCVGIAVRLGRTMDAGGVIEIASDARA